MSIDRDEFNTAIDRLYHAIDNGMSGINKRLDDLNGRTRTVEVEIATIKAKAVAYGSMAASAITFLANWLLR